jgi:uncharacterized protein YjbI with pentapeptide repeats
MLLLLLAAHLMAQAQTQSEWRDASGNVRSFSDLQEILREHQQWIKSGKKAGTEANLNKADLHGAILFHANLTDADLRDANLSGAQLFRANLTGAKLIRADLTGAHLGVANLTDADLRDAKLTDAVVIGAKLDGAIFEPSSLPKLRGMSQGNNLELLTYLDNPAALVQLRKEFEDGGFREQERKITYALKRRHAELSCDRCKRMLLTDCGSFVFNTVFFDWTCRYGMSPGRPLILGLLLWVLCSLFYFGVMNTSGESRLERSYGRSGRFERISLESTGQSKGHGRLFNSSGVNGYYCEERCFSA